jgi:hypothetical protein
MAIRPRPAALIRPADTPPPAGFLKLAIREVFLLTVKVIAGVVPVTSPVQESKIYPSAGIA